MSHPPETSLSSRELAIRLIQMPVDAVDRGEQLIDAWVRVREAEALIMAAKHFPIFVDQGGKRYLICHECGWDSRDCHIMGWQSHIEALATARKQLGEKVP